MDSASYGKKIPNFLIDDMTSLQVVLGANSREHEKLWSSYGTGAHDDLSLGEDVVVAN